MQTQIPVSGAYPPEAETSSNFFDGNTSGVSWGAALAGAAAAAALSLLLLILGFGLGLSSVSPWSYNTAPIGKATIIWLAFTQFAAAGLGGYLAGRLRVKWASVHTDEVYFRDTAHGLLAWAVATLVTATFLAGAVHTIISGAIDVAAEAGMTAGAVMNVSSDAANADSELISYFSDMLLRTDQAAPAQDNGAMRAEVGKIFVYSLRGGALAADDKRYLSRQVSRHTGLGQADADKRVDDVYARLSKVTADAVSAAKEAADKARKAASYSAIWMFVTLLLGAFFASLCATFGGRQRDNMVTVTRRAEK